MERSVVKTVRRVVYEWHSRTEDREEERRDDGQRWAWLEPGGARMQPDLGTSRERASCARPQPDGSGLSERAADIARACRDVLEEVVEKPTAAGPAAGGALGGRAIDGPMMAEAQVLASPHSLVHTLSPTVSLLYLLRCMRYCPENSLHLSGSCREGGGEGRKGKGERAAARDLSVQLRQRTKQLHPPSRPSPSPFPHARFFEAHAE